MGKGVNFNVPGKRGNLEFRKGSNCSGAFGGVVHGIRLSHRRALPVLRSWVFVNQGSRRRGFSFLAVQGPGWFLFAYLIIAQGLTALSYDLGVAMGTQEPAEEITEVGAAFYYGFAFADLVVYIPLLMAGLIGHFRGTRWGRASLVAALGITVYWPVVCLAALVEARGAAGWNMGSEAPFWIVLTAIAAWGAWGLVAVARETRGEKTPGIPG